MNSAQNKMSSSKADDGNALPADNARPSPWKLEASSSSSCVPILGDTEVWPELRDAAATTKGKASASSTARVLPEPRNANASSMRRNHDDAQTSGCGGDRDSLENPTTAAPEQSPPRLPSNNMGSTHRQNKNGGFVPQSHSQGSQGYICNRGGSRSQFGVSNGNHNRGEVSGYGNRNRGEVNGNRNRNRGGEVNGNGNRNRGDGSHGQEPHGGFNNWHPHGRSREDTHHGPGPSHRPSGPPMVYVEAPYYPYHPMNNYQMLPPLPPFPHYYGPPVGYGPLQYPEFGNGYFPPALQEAQLPPFMPYAASQHMHMMHTNLEQQAGLTPMNPLQYSTQEQQAPPRQEQEQQQAPETSPEQLQQEIRSQIEYYFSNENLARDMYLREKMDEQGWVPLTLIAGFPKVISKTTDMEFILNSILRSTEVEVQDGKIRKREGWERYPLARSN